MNHKYSTLLDSSTYDTEGLCKGIDLRRHVAADLEEIGAFRVQEDWRRLIGPLEKPYKAGLGPEFSFITVAVPDCLPDRLEIASYALEFGFIHDGMCQLSVSLRNILNEADLVQTLLIKISTKHLWTRWSKPWNRAVRLARSKRRAPPERVKSLLRFSAR